MNNEKLIKRLKWLCYAGLLCCLCWLLIIGVQTYNEAVGTTDVSVHWGDAAVQPLAGIIFVVYTVLALSLAVLAGCFFVNILRGVQRGEIFPKCNIAVIVAGAVLTFFYINVRMNMGLAFMSGSDAMPPVGVDTDSLVVPLALLVFGVMYRLGHDLARENELTI